MANQQPFVDLSWGSKQAGVLIKNVGLITTKNIDGDNIMACEWAYQLSHSPPLIGISLDPHQTTAQIIRTSKEFGVSIATIHQGFVASIAGGSSGKSFDKISALKELGVQFEKGKRIKTLLVKDSALQLECQLVNEISVGDHVLFVGEVVRVHTTGKEPLAYYQWKYWKLTENISKPSDEERARQKKVVEKHARKK